MVVTATLLLSSNPRICCSIMSLFLISNGTFFLFPAMRYITDSSSVEDVLKHERNCKRKDAVVVSVNAGFSHGGQRLYLPRQPPRHKTGRR